MWDRESDAGFSSLINQSDSTWHKPSFEQIIDSLQVAMMSGESVPMIPKTPWPSQEAHISAPSSKRRPSMPPLPSLRAVDRDAPIPGHYRSHIMRAIEGLHDVQDYYDKAKCEAKEAVEAHKRDLELFSDHSKEWIEREKRFKSEIQRLQDLLAAAGIKDEAAQMHEGRRESPRRGALFTEPEPTSSSTSAYLEMSASFHDRVNESITTSPTTCTAKTISLPPPPMGRIDLFGK